MPEPQPGSWVHPDVEVRPSEIAGRGLFATSDFPARSVVLRAAAVEHGRIESLGVDFPNHSCDPNVGWVDGSTLATMTDVPAGTELVTDYAMSTVEPDWCLRCHCPSYRCRQMVEGTDWRIPQLQRRYDGWWAPRVRRLVEASRAG
ncbi:MAG TPA: SET domain-containing protein-lysine N-methyltransferase [Nocardioides sp.]|uniref:SET domain-containing protein-lysine N-methyltransferase n=1 Tax=Nocardioides sp. TaxID=35761 RepID=UPI002F41D1EB